MTARASVVRAEWLSSRRAWRTVGCRNDASRTGACSTIRRYRAGGLPLSLARRARRGAITRRRPGLTGTAAPPACRTPPPGHGGVQNGPDAGEGGASVDAGWSAPGLRDRRRPQRLHHRPDIAANEMGHPAMAPRPVLPPARRPIVAAMRGFTPAAATEIAGPIANCGDGFTNATRKMNMLVAAPRE